jgi:DNA invertase Pin-like site-specific DNA recombinase
MYPLDSTNLKIIKYRRKSSEDEDRQVASLGDQDMALDEVAARFHIQPSQVAADFGESRSAKLSHTRPEFQKMVAMIEGGEANAILTWHPDRLSRNLGDVDTLVRLMEDRKLSLIITPQYVFGNAPLEKYMLISECTRAKLENDNKGVNVKRGLIGKVRKGWRPGVAKIGYLNNTSLERGERDILPDPERFDKVKRLLHRFLTGTYSVRQLRALANDRFLLRTRRTKRQGGKPLSLSHVYTILIDPFYCGKFLWKNQDTGEKELQQGKHIPMITEDEFWQIQALLGKRLPPQPKRHPFAYTALMTCGECSAAITAEEKWQIICGVCKRKFASQNRKQCPRCGTKIADMEKKTLLHYVYYRCTKHKGPCSQKGVRVEELESQIDSTLARFNVSEKYANWAVETVKNQAKNDGAAEAQIGRDLKREQTKLREDLAELNRFIIKQESAGWTLMSKGEALAEKQRLLSQLKQLDAGDGPHQEASDGLDGMAGALDYAAHARLWLKSGTPEQKREVFSAFGSNLTLKDKKVSICLTYPLPEIERMIEIAPEIISTFEPREIVGSTNGISPLSENIPALLRGLNAIRTHFKSKSEPFWKPQHEYFPHFARKRGKWVVIKGPEEPPREDVAYDSLQKPDIWDGPTVVYD